MAKNTSEHYQLRQVYFSDDITVEWSAEAVTDSLGDLALTDDRQYLVMADGDDIWILNSSDDSGSYAGTLSETGWLLKNGQTMFVTNLISDGYLLHECRHGTSATLKYQVIGKR